MSELKPGKVEKNVPAKRLMRQLLAATCLTAASAGVAGASTVDESTVPGADFSNTFAGANLLPVGTDTVTGSISSGVDTDFFEFSGLASGQSYSLTASQVGTGSEFLNVTTFSSDDTSLGANSFGSSGSGTVSGTIPVDGILVAQISNSEGAGAYSVSLTAATATPEPATLALTGLGLAAAGLIRRRKFAK